MDGYHLSIAVEQVAVDGKVQFTFLTIALERREPTSGSETLEQIHQWGWQPPKTAFHLHRDLSRGGSTLPPPSSPLSPPPPG